MSRNKKIAHNSLRIIGGQWRGRKLHFTPAPGLRPTLDRFRETLFNWLMFEVEGRTCLDLFAGSGALGLEALSRGTKDVYFVDNNKHNCEQIRQHLQTLGSNRGKVFTADARQWLKKSRQQFDLIFLDPPFHQDLLPRILHQLIHNPEQHLQANALIYVEAEPEFYLPTLPPDWHIKKTKSTPQKQFFLIQTASKTP